MPRVQGCNASGPTPPLSLNTPMLDFAHDDRLLPRLASPAAEPHGGRFALTQADLNHGAHSRQAWVMAIKRQVEAGTYLTAEKLDGALEMMLDSAM